jgi:hypothetical protein
MYLPSKRGCHHSSARSAPFSDPCQPHRPPSRTRGLLLQHQHQFHIHTSTSPRPPSTRPSANSPPLSNLLTMPPKSRQSAPQTATPSTTSSSTPARSSSKASGSAQDIVQGVWNNYLQKTPQRVKLLDTFMAFLVVVGALQFLYCLIVGNFVCSFFLFPTVDSLYSCMPLCIHGQTPSQLSHDRCPMNAEGMPTNRIAALQRFPLRLQRNGRPIRPHRLAPHPDQPREQGRFREHLA